MDYNGFSYQTKNITLTQDLKRRDLTINSMALDLQTRHIIDPFNGKKDLQNKILRPYLTSFLRRTPLRVLRIARFRAKLGIKWKIHPSTKALIYTMKKELKFLEPNRIYQETITALSYKKLLFIF